MSIKKTTDAWKTVGTQQQLNLDLADKYVADAAISKDPLQVGVALTQQEDQKQIVAAVNAQIALSEQGQPGTQTTSPPTTLDVPLLSRSTAAVGKNPQPITQSQTTPPPSPIRDILQVVDSPNRVNVPPEPRILEADTVDEQADTTPEVVVTPVRQSEIAIDDAAKVDAAPPILNVPSTEAAPLPAIVAVAREQANLGELGINTDLPQNSITSPPFDEFARVDQQIAAVARDQQTENANLGLLGINTDIVSENVNSEITRMINAGVEQARNSNLATREANGIDWRFRISLGEGTNYLYNDPDIDKITDALLFPLRETRGVLFPYTPKIDLTYTANYDAVDIAHTNYKFYNYKNSSVESISISGDFTAQDTYEANYLLAVIHFFKSVTKMFYGKDNNPRLGIPPPLCYLTGHGTYAFNKHPCVITSFTLNYPTDVDYVNAKIPIGTLQGAPEFNKPVVGPPTRWQRVLNLKRQGVDTGGTRVDPVFRNPVSNLSELTRVPSKLGITVTALPVVTRNDLSNNFSLKGYARGDLLTSNRKKLSGKPSVGGFW